MTGINAMAAKIRDHVLHGMVTAIDRHNDNVLGSFEERQRVRRRRAVTSLVSFHPIRTVLAARYSTLGGTKSTGRPAFMTRSPASTVMGSSVSSSARGRLATMRSAARLLEDEVGWKAVRVPPFGAIARGDDLAKDCFSRGNFARRGFFLEFDGACNARHGCLEIQRHRNWMGGDADQPARKAVSESGRQFDPALRVSGRGPSGP